MSTTIVQAYTNK